jgi:hypothetical protein
MHEQLIAGRQRRELLAREELYLERDHCLAGSECAGGVDAFAGQFSRSDAQALDAAIVDLGAPAAAGRLREPDALKGARPLLRGSRR